MYNRDSKHPENQGVSIDEIIRFQTMTVEERYLEFLKKPGFMQLISVKQMALTWA